MPKKYIGTVDMEGIKTGLLLKKPIASI